jgi:uncharacterized membrane protein
MPRERGLEEHLLARGLGWFSIGLGLAEVLAPRAVARWIGACTRNSLVEAMGAREIASGIGILSQPGRSVWLWSRVAGDAMDLAFLGAQMTSRRAHRGALAAAVAAVVGVTALDVYCARKLSQRGGPSGAIHVRHSVTINRPAEELYRFWRDFENLPRFMKHLESVRTVGERRSHWVARAPAGTTIEWDAEIAEDRPNQLIAWRSLEGSPVEHSGWVEFEPATGERGTVVRVDFRYRPPAGQLGALVARLFGEEPRQQVREDLRRFKQVVETGEVITTEGQPAGRAESTSWKFDQTIRSYPK